MRILSKNEALCSRCRRCEEVCASIYFKEKNVEKSAIRIGAGTDGATSITVCSQCGLCETICPIQAIRRDAAGVLRIDKRLCVGCLACVGFCPEAAMFHYCGDGEPFKCIACGICAKKCPTAAIELTDGRREVQP